MKQGVIPDELTAPFWEAANEGRLVIQNCAKCERLQNPPLPACSGCGSAEAMGWKEMSGRGTVYNYCVVYDTPVALLQEDEPFNLAVVTLEEDPGIQMYSHLPGTAVDEVPIGGRVEVTFETTANGQKVPEWRVVDEA